MIFVNHINDIISTCLLLKIGKWIKIDYSFHILNINKFKNAIKPYTLNKFKKDLNSNKFRVYIKIDNTIVFKYPRNKIQNIKLHDSDIKYEIEKLEKTTEKLTVQINSTKEVLFELIKLILNNQHSTIHSLVDPMSRPISPSNLELF